MTKKHTILFKHFLLDNVIFKIFKKFKKLNKFILVR